MTVNFKFAEDKMGRKVCSIENESMVVQIVLKRDFSDVEMKIKNMHLLEYIEKVLDEGRSTNEFDELVDSYGYLSPDHISE